VGGKTRTAEAARGRPNLLAVSPRLPHASFPGGLARTPLLVLAMTWFRLRDLL